MFFNYKIQNPKLRRKGKCRLGIAMTFLTVFVCFLFTVQAQIDTVQHRYLNEQFVRFTPPAVQTKFNVNQIGLQQIEKQQGNGSVNNLLELMPSMITTSDAGTGLGYTYMRVRGIDQTRINVTLNGVTVNDAESQGSWLVNLPDMGSYIEEVNVQRGGNAAPGAVSYGAHIDFVTREIPVKPFAEVNSAYGSFNTFHNTVSAGTGLINKRFAAMASFSDIRSDGYIDRADAQLNSVFFAAKYRLLNFRKNKDYGTLKFNLLHGSEHTGLAWNGVPYDSLTVNRTYNSCGEYYTDEGERRYYADDKDNYRQTHYQLSYMKHFEKLTAESKPSRYSNLSVLAHLTRGIGYYQEYQDDQLPEQYGLRLLSNAFSTADFVTQKYLDNYFYGLYAEYASMHNLKPENKDCRQTLKWTVGTDVDNYNGKHYGNVIWAQPGHVQDLPVDYKWYFGTGDKLQTKLFASLEYNRDRFLLFGELQSRFIDYKIGGTDYTMSDVTQQYQYLFVNPKIFLQYDLAKKPQNHHYLFFSISMANREPTRSDIIEAPAHQKPKPEGCMDLELGYSLTVSNFRLDATVYGMYYKDQLVLTGELNDVGAAIMANVDDSYRCGLELSAAYNPVKFFNWRINGCFSRNRILDYVNYVDDWDNGGQIEEHLGNTPISFSPDIVLANDFTFTPLKNFEIDVVTKFVSKQYLDNSGDNTFVLKPYSYTNLRLSYHFSVKCLKEIGVFFQINNIFNAHYESNAWIYSYYYNNARYADAGYYPQAGIHFLGGLKLKF